MPEKITMYYEWPRPDLEFEKQLRDYMDQLGYNLTDTGFGFGERELIFHLKPDEETNEGERNGTI